MRISDWSSDVCSSDLSMIASAKPSASAALIQGDNLRALNGSTWGSSAVRLSPHVVALSCGSRSIRAVLIPPAWAATARLTDRGVFPAQTFCAAIAILFDRKSVVEGQRESVRVD